MQHEHAHPIRLDDADTQALVGYLAQQGHLTAERIAQILDPAWNPA